jgi:hypothetical protein
MTACCPIVKSDTLTAEDCHSACWWVRIGPWAGDEVVSRVWMYAGVRVSLRSRQGTFEVMISCVRARERAPSHMHQIRDPVKSEMPFSATFTVCAHTRELE